MKPHSFISLARLKLQITNSVSYTICWSTYGVYLSSFTCLYSV